MIWVFSQGAVTVPGFVRKENFGGLMPWCFRNLGCLSFESFEWTVAGSIHPLNSKLLLVVLTSSTLMFIFLSICSFAASQTIVPGSPKQLK